MIVGTAGHIDHGKTALVKALTGIDTDRLPEEKRRGITVELGFAHLDLPSGRRVGVVDVPGHEKFIKAMAAGAGGVDLVMLVVSSDEGVKPQTREHLDICRLLGVRAGVVVLTKCDLQAASGLSHQLDALLEGTFLESAKRLGCSARTGEGVAQLVAELDRLAYELGERSAQGPLLLPIDRCFAVKGFGTVVTGSLYSGTLAAGDSLMVLPQAKGPFRIRGLEVHGQKADQAVAGQRVAVNLAGVEVSELSRGMALSRSEELKPASRLEVELTLLPKAQAKVKALGRSLRVHLGTVQVEATAAAADLKALATAGTGVTRLRLAKPVAAIAGQRFIVRGTSALPGRGNTWGGGRVLRLSPPRKRAVRVVSTPVVSKSAAGDEDSALRLQALQALCEAGLAPPTVEVLARELGATPTRVLTVLKAAQGEVCRLEEGRYAHAEAIASLRRRLLEYLDTHREISTQAFKELSGQSRKFAIPLAELFDREKVTLRVGDKRVRRKSAVDSGASPR